MKRSLGAKTLAMPSPVWVVGAAAAGALNRTAVAGARSAARSLRRPWFPCVGRRVSTPAWFGGRRSPSMCPRRCALGRQTTWASFRGGGDGAPCASAGLTAVPSGLVDALHGRTLPLNPECRLVDSLQFGLQTLFVGEIVDVKVDEEVAGGRIGQAVATRTTATA